MTKIIKITYKTPRGDINEGYFVEIIKGKYVNVMINEGFYLINSNDIKKSYEVEINLNGQFVKK